MCKAGCVSRVHDQNLRNRQGPCNDIMRTRRLHHGTTRARVPEAATHSAELLWSQRLRRFSPTLPAGSGATG